jgi:hypothetical protein
VAIAFGIGACWRFLPAPSAPFVADSVTQLDVGQGDAALLCDHSGIRTRCGLVDTGSARALQAMDWMRLLAREEVDTLEFVTLTHRDEDHRGGLSSLRRVVPGVRVVETAEASPIPAFSIPCAEKGISGHAEKRRNCPMLAFAAPLRGGGLYLNLGDSTKEMEGVSFPWARAWVDRAGRGPVYFKASHHGSRYSSDPNVLRRLFAGVESLEIWISAGVGNPHGHPTTEALLALHSLGIRPECVRRTDEEGDIHPNEGLCHSRHGGETGVRQKINEYPHGFRKVY